MASMKEPVDRCAEVAWVGKAKEELLAFPTQVVKDFGRSLRHLQRGEPPRLESRPMPSIGPGAFELKDGDERAWYRLVYLSVLDGVIYVLNCFEKSSRKTDRRDLQTAKSRMAIARKIAQERREKR